MSLLPTTLQLNEDKNSIQLFSSYGQVHSEAYTRVCSPRLSFLSGTEGQWTAHLLRLEGSITEPEMHIAIAFPNANVYI